METSSNSVGDNLKNPKSAQSNVKIPSEHENNPHPSFFSDPFGYINSFFTDEPTPTSTASHNNVSGSDLDNPEHLPLGKIAKWLKTSLLPHYFSDISDVAQSYQPHRIAGTEPRRFDKKIIKEVSDSIKVRKSIEMILDQKFGPLDVQYSNSGAPLPGSLYEIRQREAEKQIILSRVHEIVLDLAADFDKRVLYPTAYFLRKLWSRIFPVISVSKDELSKVRKIASEYSLILTPTHRSHIDYLILGYFFFFCDIALPYIAAGDNLGKMPVISHIMRGLGAFFIKRQFNDDPLYKAVFKEYVSSHILLKGINLQFFIEGGRSRTGKLLQPKFGLLNICVDSYLNAQRSKLKDIFFVPINITYSRVVESRSYVRELLGGRKEKETVSLLLKSANRVLNVNFGRIDIRFGDPISLEKFVHTTILSKRGAFSNHSDPQVSEKPPKSPSPTQSGDISVPEINPILSADTNFNTHRNKTGLVSDIGQRTSQNPFDPNYDPINIDKNRRHLVSSLGYTILYEINKISVALPTALVATILLANPGRGLSRTSLIDKVSWLARLIIDRGGRVVGLYEDMDISGLSAKHIKKPRNKATKQTSKTIHKGSTSLVQKHGTQIIRAVDAAVETLDRTIYTHLNLFEPIYSAQKQLELSFYRNSIMHVFVSEAIIGCALYSFIHDPSPRTMLLPKRTSKNSRLKNTLLFSSLPQILKIQVPASDLISRVAFLSGLLKLEFIFKSSPNIISNFTETLSKMLMRKIVFEPEKFSEDNFSSFLPQTIPSLPTSPRSSPKSSIGIYGNTQSTQSLFNDICCRSSSDYSPAANQLKKQYIAVNPSEYDTFLFLCSLLWPFIDAYFVSTLSCFSLLSGPISAESFYMKSLTLAETMYFSRELKAYETISKDTMKNAVTLLTSWGVLDMEKNKTLRLKGEWKSQENLCLLVEKIGVLRHSFALGDPDDPEDRHSRLRELSETMRRSNSPKL